MVTKLSSPEAKVQLEESRTTSLQAVAQGVQQYTAVLTTSDPGAVAVMLELWRATHAHYIDNCRAIDELSLPVSVTGKRLAILRSLYFAPQQEMSLVALCRTVRLGPATVANYVDSLARGSLVRRFCSPADGHGSVVRLTPKGETSFNAISQALSASWTNACRDFTEEEKDTLYRLLRRLAITSPGRP